MLDQMKQHKKDTSGKSSEELLKGREKQHAETKGKLGRPTKYPRTSNTKRMNIYLPGDIHKQLRLASATVDGEPSMNEIIIDILYATIKFYPEQIK